MKVVILAGGFGTRISEESFLKPKPMIEIGGKPILWHIMKHYYFYGYNEFIICAGYKQYVIKEYFDNYFLHNCDLTYDFVDGGRKVTVHDNETEAWKVTIVDTGLNTMTGGRIKRIQKYIGNNPFMLTYGDGVSNININTLVEYHKKHGKIGTMSSVRPESRFGNLDIVDGQVLEFREKNIHDGNWINCGFMVFQPEIFDEISGDDTIFEREPLWNLAKKGQLMSYQHEGFWQCMDTLRDKEKLEKLWGENKAEWKVWG